MIFAAAMSLSVALCYEMAEPATTRCLRQTFDEALDACNVEKKNAAQRLGQERGQNLYKLQTKWVKKLAETCKVPIANDGTVDVSSDQTNFACLIDETNKRITELKEVAYHAWGDEP
jgi:uncharacterized protein YecT (DUF1311 family)